VQPFFSFCIQRVWRGLIFPLNLICQEKDMPIFEFVCEECKKAFEELVFSSSAIDRVKCPDCGGQQVKKKVSTFASKISGGSSLSLGSSSAACSTGSV
jgi:putative FmdB family regulatory protein